MTTNELKEAFMNAASTSKGKVYKYFPKNLDFFNDSNRKIIKQADCSYAFPGCIAEAFNICSPEFHNAFHEATSGEGQEKDKINTIHSSSLIGLLCFYNISENNKMEITLPFERKEVHFVFNKVKFEKTNPVFSHSVGLSSIDIALYGTADNKKAVLYLESKFSEYLHKENSVSSDKAKQYKPFYEELKDEFSEIGLSFSYSNKKGVEDQKLHISGEHYCQGIKQMISHTIGAINSDEEETEIYLAPILYNFWDNQDGDNAYSDYCKVYKGVAPGLKRLCHKKDYNSFFSEKYSSNPTKEKNNNKIFISDTVISYQFVFKNTNIQLAPAVKEYYDL